MKNRILICLLLCLSLLLSGCGLWMSGEYYSERPHQDDSVVSSSSEITISSYAQLCNQMVKMVSAGSESCVIYYSSIDRQRMEGYMENAIQYVMQETPIGAYAVESISYDSGTNSGKKAVAVFITYTHGRSEILRIRKAANMDIFKNILSGSMKNFDPSITISVTAYEEMDIPQFIQDYVDQNPDSCMELPQVVANVYPQEGKNRIIEVIFTYQTSRDELRKMQQTVSPIFDSAELYVSGDADDSEKYFQLYSFLMERHNYKIETSLTPTYHLLRHGVGDSKAFAVVYAAMCRRAELDCQVVTGTKNGELRYWNVIFDGENYMFIDLLSCNEKGRFFTQSAEDMVGYVWDYDLYQPVKES